MVNAFDCKVTSNGVSDATKLNCFEIFTSYKHVSKCSSTHTLVGRESAQL